MSKSRLFINKDFREESYYPIERREIAPNFYGLICLADIPAMRVVGKYEPVMLYEFRDHDLINADNIRSNVPGKLLTELACHKFFKDPDREEYAEAANAIANLTPRLSIEELIKNAKGNDLYLTILENYNRKLDANKFSDGKVEFVYSLPSSMNHSCSPNCIFDFETGTLHTLKNLKKGDEMRIYYRLEGNFDEQRENLKACWEFDCDCGFCEKPAPDVDTPIDYLYNEICNKCHNCSKSFTSGVNRAEPRYKCPQCKISKYCSRGCFESHYGTHLKLCKLGCAIGAFHHNK